MRTILLTFILMVQCGSLIQREYQYHTGDFEPYVQAFKQDAKKFNLDISIVDLLIIFGNLNEDDDNEYFYLGICYTYTDKTPLIRIDEAIWKTLDEVERKLLIYHELGHCILNKDHDDDSNNIMNTLDVDSQYFIENEQEVLAHLFSGVESPDLNQE
jgi:Zn-dependent peptidase ImmA (M78 family)